MMGVMVTRVTVATINLHGRADRWPERRHLLTARIVEAQPDLVSFQEIYLPIRQGTWLCKQVNYRLSGSEKQPYRLVQKRYQHPIKGYLEGVGVLTRLPILYHDGLGLGYGGRVALRVHVELPSHQTMDFVSTHLHHIPFDKQAREEQSLKLVGWLQSHKTVPLQVIAGDFNEPPSGLAVKYVKQSFRSAYEEYYGREPLATYPTALIEDSQPASCIDYILISPAVRRVVEANLFCDQPSREDNTLYPSDHVGLIAKLEV
ncbi:MAG: endonuclease/exonuclease/phosphatase family protein [Candidatus Promineifilaceae bacterium]|nr:endonuclease/exonuclease/phosphatase family protein [Candidatus Promineifilaceae bacterium]